VAVIYTFFLSASRHPDALAKAQSELDTVVGHDRLPTIDDRSSLPYVEAFITEVMRYGPPLPAGLPHMAMDDDIYEGYLIEKGTMIMANIWYGLA
jgi:cytochrome P450